MIRMGRPSLFPGAKSERVQALISKAGMRCFEKRRQNLARLARLEPSQVSDAAVVEYLARGHDETLALLAYADSAKG